MTSFEWDTNCADLELRRLQDGFTGYDHLNFTRVMLMAYSRTIQDVHIDTGSLLSSGRVNALDTSGDRWSGEISYGGTSAGINNPVKYAAQEYFRGGQHDYLRSTEFIGETFMGPVSSFFSRGRRTPHPEAGAL